MLRASPMDIHSDVVPHYRQPAYNNYTGFLPAYIAAMVQKRRIAITQPFHPIGYKDKLFPINMPAIAVSFPNAIPNGMKRDLELAGYEEAVVKGSKIVIVNNVNMDLVQALQGSGASMTAVAPGNSINISCIPVIAAIRKILSAFFRMHSYPAFRDDKHLNDIAGMELEVGIGKRGLVDDTIEIEERPSQRIRVGESGESSAVKQTLPLPSTGETVHVALPAQPAEGWIDDDDAVPTTGGLFFPYVSDLASPDKKTLPRVMSYFFLGCFGTNKNDVMNQMDTLRARWGVIYDTELGKEWSHMAFVIDIGLRAQARIIPVFSEGNYHGCVLSGVGYTINLNGKVYEPISQDRLQEELMHSSRQGVVLGAIGLLAKGTNDMNNEDVAEFKKVRSIYELKMLLEKSPMTESDKDEVVKLALKLRFGKHWPLNDSTIVSALYLAASDNSIEDVPLHPSVLFEHDRLALVWSGFGPLAPTCHFLGGPVVDLNKSVSGSISWKTVPLHTAISDLRMIAAQKKFSKAQGGRRSGPFKDRTFEGKRSTPIWNALKNFAGSSFVGGDEGSGEGGQGASSANAGVFTDFSF
jgi:hypothetical protein